MIRKKIIKRLFLSLAAGSFLLSGCGFVKSNSPDDEITITEAQNDYAGAYQRLTGIQNDVMDIMSILEKHNQQIKASNPDDYWAEDAYRHLDFRPVYSEELSYGQYLNEIDNFTDVAQYMVDQLVDMGYESVSVYRNSANNYIIQYSGWFTDENTWQDRYGTKSMTCQYNPTSNSLRVNSTLKYNGSYDEMNDFFYEFAEVGKRAYEVQNNNERLFVRYDDNGEIIDFYYSELKKETGYNANNYLDYKTVTELNDKRSNGILYCPDKEADKNYYAFFDDKYILYNNENGILSEIGAYPCTPDFRAITTGSYDMYINSIYSSDKLGKEWVMECNSFERTVSYKDDKLEIMYHDEFTGEKYHFAVKRIYKLVKTDTATGTVIESSPISGEEARILNNGGSLNKIQNEEQKAENTENADNENQLDESSE